jgi:hypothetical protein
MLRHFRPAGISGGISPVGTRHPLHVTAHATSRPFATTTPFVGPAVFPLTLTGLTVRTPTTSVSSRGRLPRQLPWAAAARRTGRGPIPVGRGSLSVIPAPGTVIPAHRTVIPGAGEVVPGTGISSRGPLPSCPASLTAGIGPRTVIRAPVSLGSVHVPDVTGPVSVVRLPQLVFPRPPMPLRGPENIVRGPGRDESAPIPVGIVAGMTVRGPGTTVRDPGMTVTDAGMTVTGPGMIGRDPLTTDTGRGTCVRGPLVTRPGRGKAPRAAVTAGRGRLSRRRGRREDEAGDRMTSTWSLRFGPGRPTFDAPICTDPRNGATPTCLH